MSFPDRAPRARGVMVKVLDLSPLKPDMIALTQQADPTVTDVKFVWEWALAVDVDGRQHLLCSEGVGAVCTDDDPYPVDVYDDTERFNAEGNRMMSVAPIGTLHLTPTVAAGLSFEEVDLADFVRTFGGRLETNFWANYATLSGIELSADAT